MENQYSPPENVKNFKQNLDGKVEGVLQKIDNGNIFKTIIVFFFKLISWGIVAAGLWACIINIFSQIKDGYVIRYGYFSRFEAIDGMQPLYGMQPFTSIIGFIIGLVLCLATIYVIFLFVSKRANQLADSAYEGLIHYMYQSVGPTVIMMFGEALALLVCLVGILSLVAAVLSSLVYFPLNDFYMAFAGVLDTDFHQGGIWIQGFSEYNTYFESLKSIGVGSLGIMAASAFVLALTYVIKEVYQYVVSLLIKLVEFSITKNGILILFIGLVLSYVVINGFFAELFEGLF